MSETPKRRTSLRRKHSSTRAKESPVPKKSSPSCDTNKGGVCAGASQKRTSRHTRSTSSQKSSPPLSSSAKQNLGLSSDSEPASGSQVSNFHRPYINPQKSNYSSWMSTRCNLWSPKKKHLEKKSDLEKVATTEGKSHEQQEPDNSQLSPDMKVDEQSAGEHTESQVQIKELVERSLEGFATPSRPQQSQKPAHNRVRQFSPDMPVMCSQLVSSQECEVVWNCDSPGFSKEELKRMHSDGSESEGGSGASPHVTSTPGLLRALFPRLQAAKRSSASECSTNTQIDLVLDQLSRKIGSTTNSKSTDPQPLEILESESEETLNLDEDSSSPPSPNLLQICSSQVFTLKELVQEETAGEEDIMNVATVLDDLNWEEELDMKGACDSKDTTLISDSEGRQAGEGHKGYKPFVEEPGALKATENITFEHCSGARGSEKEFKTHGELKQPASLSEKGPRGVNLIENQYVEGPKDRSASESSEFTKIFDDSFFDESLIRSTQELEKALIRIEDREIGASAVNYKNNGGMNSEGAYNTGRSVSRSSDSKCDISHKYPTECSSSPVLGNPQLSVDNPFKRRFRKTFSLNVSKDDLQKESLDPPLLLPQGDIAKDRVRSNITVTQKKVQCIYTPVVTATALLTNKSQKDSSSPEKGSVKQVDCVKPTQNQVRRFKCDFTSFTSGPRRMYNDTNDMIANDRSNLQVSKDSVPRPQSMYGPTKVSNTGGAEIKTSDQQSRLVTDATWELDDDNDEILAGQLNQVDSDMAKNNQSDSSPTEKKTVKPVSNPEKAGTSRTGQISDIPDDDLFDDDVLSVVDEIESQCCSQTSSSSQLSPSDVWGSQQSYSQPTQQSHYQPSCSQPAQQSHYQLSKNTKQLIAQKRLAALRRKLLRAESKK